MPKIPGPSGPLRYQRDQWGYPQVWVKDIDEGAYARGYLHATDRLVQIYLALMAGQGRMMELLGDVPVARMLDRAIRALDFTSDLDLQAEKLDPQTRSLLEAYCAGFNAGQEGRTFPIVLRALGVSPVIYRPAHVVLMYRFVSYFGLTSMHHLLEGVIAEIVSEGISEEGLSLLLGDTAKGTDLDALSQMSFPESYAFLKPPPQAGGSNAFAVDAKHSATGGALLMGEFHMEVGRFPPILYAVHTHYADQSYYSGLGIPGLAWLSAGRTPDIGWTYTFGHADNIDIMVETCKEGSYLAGDEWHALQRRVEVFFIKDKEPEQWVFYENDYGTVLGDALKEGTYPCVRWSGLRTHSATDINAVRKAIEAKEASVFLALHRDIRVLSLATVVADKAGNIGYTSTGQVDQRPKGWQGTTPRPAHDLSSRTPAPLPESSRPYQYNPPSGYIVSANEATPGADGAQWVCLPEPPYRFERITELLNQHQAPDLNALVDISYDEVDICARKLLAVWQPLLPQGAEARSLVQWSQFQTNPSTPEGRQQMALFYALHYELMAHLLRPHLGQERTDRLLHELGLGIYFQHFIDPVLALEKPEVLDEAGLRALLQTTWPLALERASSKEWALPPRAPFKNVLTQGQLPTWTGFSSPPIDLPGSPVAPFQSRVVKLQGETMVAGPVFHICFDMSKPGSWYNIAGGASESRFGPGYGKGLDAWREGTFAPLGPARGKAPKHRHSRS